MISRRSLLKTGLLLGGSRELLIGQALAATGSEAKHTPFRCLIPGYAPRRAYYQGRMAIDAVGWNKYLPANYRGPLSMLTRVGEPGKAVKRAVYPILGHGLCLHPDGKRGFFAANQHPDNQMLVFDTNSLEPIKFLRVNRKGWSGGGHAMYTADGKHLLISERYPDSAFSGDRKQHYGVITIRDADSHEVVGEYSCYGIAPHEIALTRDGQYLAIANYGSTRPTGKGDNKLLPEIIEPSLTILEMSSGRLVEKISGPDIHNEIRHLSAPDLQRIFTIQARVGDHTAGDQAMSGFDEIYERDITADKGQDYLPALPLHLRHSTSRKTELMQVSGMQPFQARHGLSIIYEPDNDEILASFPSAHNFAVFDATSGRLKKLIRTDNIGLRHPCGLALHPDGKHYIVTGYWRNMYVFKRGSHALNRDACQYISLFGHSHIAA